MIIVTGTLYARAETIKEVLALSREHVQRSRAEPGCLEHGVAVDVDDPLHLLFFERWADSQAIGTHLKLPASRAFGAAVAALVDRPPTLSIFDARELPLR